MFRHSDNNQRKKWKKSNTKCKITHLKQDSIVAKYGCSKLSGSSVACLVNFSNGNFQPWGKNNTTQFRVHETSS